MILKNIEEVIFMARVSKPEYQMYNRMEEMKCTNESRHEVKKEYKEMIHILL